MLVYMLDHITLPRHNYGCHHRDLLIAVMESEV